MTNTPTRVESVADVPVTDSTVVVGEHERYLGQLVFQTPDQTSLLRRYSQFISKHGVLSDTGLYEAFTQQLIEDGFEVFLLPSTDQVLEWHSQWAGSLKVDGVELFDKKTGEPSSLHPYQQYGLRKALFEYPDSFREVYGSGFFFFNWGTGCLSLDTYLHTENGLCQLRDVVHTDSPNSQWADSSFRLSTRVGTERASQTFHHGLDRGLSVKTRLGLGLQGTRNHKVLSITPNGLGWRELGELQSGDHTLVPRRSRQFGSREIDLRLARLLGWVVSEGCCSAKSEVVEITQYREGSDKTDPDGNEDVRQLVSWYRGREVPSHPHHYQLPQSVTRRLVQETGLALCTSREKSVPTVVMQGTREVVAEFLKALFEGDAEVNKTTLEYTTASERLAREVQQLLLGFGIVSRLSSRESYASNTELQTRRVYWSVTLYDSVVFEQQIGLISRRKRQRLRERNCYKSTQKNKDSNQLPYISEWTRDIESQLKTSVPLSEARRVTGSTNGPVGLWPKSSPGSGPKKNYNSPRDVWAVASRNTRGMSHYALEYFLTHMKVWEGYLDENSRRLWRDLEEIRDQYYFVDQVESVEECEGDFWDLSVPGSNSYLANGVVTHNTGKTVAACSGAQELFNRGRIDLVIVFTLRQVKVDFTRFANTATNLRAVAVDGEKDQRRKEYRRGEAEMYVLNYEKARKSVDLSLLLELVKGKRVLFVFDEVQKILNENTNREGVNQLLDSVEDKFVWPMSASIIDGDPDRYWKVFEWMKRNPLGTLKQFHRDYVERTENRKFIVRTRNGPFPVYETIHHFDFTKLDEVRHRVAPWTHSVRKTDPGVREFFKGLNFVEVPVEMDPADRQVYNLIVEEAEEYKKSTEPVEGVTPATFYQALRYTCLGLESHKYSDNALSKVISAKPVSNKTCAKLERLLDDVAMIIDEGDKVVIFTHWTNLSLFRISEALEKKKIAHVVHHGGQSLSQNEEAKTEFKTNPQCRVFLSSDAGSHGLNLPEARYVLNYDTPFSYDTLMQRCDRIDRADSWLDGLEARIYYYEDTIEERIWEVNNYRRYLASIVQGTEERLHRPPVDLDADESNHQMMDWLMFGSKGK